MAEGRIIDAAQLANRGFEVARNNEIRLTAQEIDRQLRVLAFELEERYRAQEGGVTAGNQAVAFNRFAEQMDLRYNTHRKTASQDSQHNQVKPGFYLEHSQNPNLRHSDQWIEEIRRILPLQSRAAVAQGSLVGEGGGGKTAVAIEYAYQCRGDYPGGVYWLEVDQGAEIPIPNMLKRMELAVPDEEARLLPYFVDCLNSITGKKLLILDNVEDIALPNRFALTNCHLLASTRNPKIALQTIDMDLPNEDQAIDILLGYSHYRHESLTDLQEKIARQLCRRCGYLPLALEILGTMLDSYGLEGVSEITDDLLDETENVTSKKAETTIRQVLAVTKKQYSHPRSMETLVYAAYLHPDNIDTNLLTEAMEAGRAETLKALAALGEWSFVKLSKYGGYFCHRLVQEAARNSDSESKCGNKMGQVLNSHIQKEREIGNYLAGQSLVVHLKHIAEISKISFPMNQFPGTGLLEDFAHFLWMSGMFLNAKNIMEHVLERKIANLGSDNPSTLTAWYKLAVCLHSMGDLNQALKILERILEVRQKTLGEEHPKTLSSQSNYALTVKVDEAAKLHKHVLEIRRRTLGEEHLDTLVSMNNLAIALWELGEHLDAFTLMEQVVDLSAKKLGTEHPRTLASQESLQQFKKGLGR